MKAFKTCAKITRGHLLILTIYVIIFTVLLLLFSGIMSANNPVVYEPSRTRIAVINRDSDTPLLRGLEQFLSQKGELVPLADDDTAIRDALIYGEIQYAVTVPEGFTAAFLSGEEVQLDTLAIKQQAGSVFAEQFVNQYLSCAELYVRAGITDLSTLPDALAQHAQIELKQYTDLNEISSYTRVFYGMFGYVMLSLMILTTSTILMAFNHVPVRRRIACSPARPVSVNLQIAAFLCLIAFAYTVFWTLIALIPMLVQGTLPDSRRLLLLTGNALCLAGLSLSISFLCGIFIKKITVQNAVANFVSLILSFLGGLFVPTSLLSEQVLTVSKFTPLYWYASAVDQVTSLADFTAASLRPVWTSMAIELAFAAAILLIALFLLRNRGRESSLKRS